MRPSLAAVPVIKGIRVGEGVEEEGGRAGCGKLATRTSRTHYFSMNWRSTPLGGRESLYRRAEPKKAQPTWGELCPCPGSFVGQNAA